MLETFKEANLCLADFVVSGVNIYDERTLSDSETQICQKELAVVVLEVELEYST